MLAGVVRVAFHPGTVGAEDLRTVAAKVSDQAGGLGPVPATASPGYPGAGPSATSAPLRAGVDALPPPALPLFPPPADPAPPPAPPPPATISPPSDYTLLGSTELSGTTAGFKDFETWQGKGTRIHNAIVDYFINWNFSNPSADDTSIAVWTNIWNQGSVPMVSWMVPLHDSLLSAGAYDNYIREFVTKVRTWLAGPDGVYGTADDRRLFLRPAPESNGNWNYWSPNTGLPGDATFQANVANWKRGWARLHDLFAERKIDGTRIQWVFAVSHDDAYRPRSITDHSPEPVTEDIFPGNAYVDWVAIDGYAKTATDTPAAIFEKMIGRLQRLTGGSKPLGIAEVGSYSFGGVAAKNAWIDSYFSWLQTQPLKMSLYWNSPDQDQNTDLKIFGTEVRGDATYVPPGGGPTYGVYSHYADNVAGNPRLVAADPGGNARLITDQRFAGG
jgi:hypothetical protein